MKRKETIASLLVSTCLFISPAPASTGKNEMPAPTTVAEKKLTDQTTADMRKAAAKSKNDIVANVEGADISTYDLVRMMNRVASAFYADVERLTPEINKEIQKRALDRLIFEELAVREAIQQKITVAPEKIDKVIDETKKLYPTDKEYQKYLDNIRITEKQLRIQIERRRLLQGITGKEVYQKVTIDPKDVDRLYKDYIELGKLKKADAFFIKEIILLKGENRKTVEATANELLARLKSYNYNFGKFILDGKFIIRNLRVKKDKLPVIFKRMEGMQPGDFSGVVEDGGTFHIFKVIKNEHGGDMTREEATGILEDRLAPYSQEKRKAAWIEELKKDAKITIYEEKLEKMIEGKE